MQTGSQAGNRFAAVDLGSNSFRMEIGRFEHGDFRRIEYIKETVRQGAGLDADRNLTPQAMQLGWDCLARFGERLAGFNPSEVRAVATQTLREARNRDDFLLRANELLGFPINVISGREEGRLIYQGVAYMLPESQERRLVIDIGGRSTELILGLGTTPRVMESFRVGCTAWSKRFFPDGQFTKRAFEVAEIAAMAVMDEAFEAYHPDNWDIAYGSAGTVSAIDGILLASGWHDGAITQKGLDWLQERLIAAQSVERLRMAGLREERKTIIAGGVSILRAVFKLLGIKSLTSALGSLRHGLIYDLLGGSDSAGDQRVRSVRRLASTFQVDSAHGERVAHVATSLFSSIMGHTDIQPANGRNEQLRCVRKLQWAAQLHEIGRHISHSDYHRHGAYILENSDAVGFSLPEMHRLSVLVMGHRGRLRKVESALGDDGLVMQLMALRLAVILCHARRDPDLEGMTFQRAGPQVLRLAFRPGWAAAYPQSAHLLREEVCEWQKTSWSLEISIA
ncbi:MAG: Ppx/GppA family phosphatase [Rhodoferax sp.]|nr:Ppx/GppA family phosphatase [Rhodoferax sp.]